MQAVLYYFHDPMCSWCWGFKPVWQALCERLPEALSVQYVAGGLAPDTDAPMPEAMRRKLQQTWRQIHQQLGTEFNFDFWTDCKPRRSTWLACRAVIAASLQAQEKEMIYAIQQGYYLRAMNPSDLDTLVTFAEELGLDMPCFQADIQSDVVEQLFQQQRALAEQMPIQGFPSLVLAHGGRVWPLSLDYLNAGSMLAQIEALLLSPVD